VNTKCPAQLVRDTAAEVTARASGCSCNAAVIFSINVSKCNYYDYIHYQAIPSFPGTFLVIIT